jgi:spindle assembly abnormal protein 6
MPLVLEEDVRLANGFDPASAGTLYWKQVPVLVKQHDREDQTEQLTFRILSGVTRQNHNLRVSSVNTGGCYDYVLLAPSRHAPP